VKRLGTIKTQSQESDLPEEEGKEALPATKQGQRLSAKLGFQGRRASIRPVSGEFSPRLALPEDPHEAWGAEDTHRRRSN